MATGSQGSYTLLVANFSRPTPSLIFGADPDTAGPTKTRGGFVFGHIQSIGFSSTLTQSGQARSLITNTTNMQIDPFEATPPEAPSGVVTVSSNTFSPGSAGVIVGPFTLIVNRDFVPGGGAAATATALAAAIDALPGYTGAAVGADVTVTGPLGSAPASLAFAAVYYTSTRNFTFTYVGVTGVLGYTNSPLHVDILPTTPNWHAPP
jgi:hypothetical protein